MFEQRIDARQTEAEADADAAAAIEAAEGAIAQTEPTPELP